MTTAMVNLATGLIPTDLPSQWTPVRLRDICDEHKQPFDPLEGELLPYVGLEHIISGSPRLVSYSSSDQVRSTKTRFHPGQVLYGKLRPYLDKAVLATIEGVCSTDIIVLDCINGTDPGYLVNLLHSADFVVHATSTMTGVNHPRTHWSSIKEYRFPLPPLTEQRRIAAVLNTIQDAIAAQEDVIAAAKEFKRSLMQRLFTYGPYREPAETKMTEIGEIPAHWEVLDLAQVVKETQYGLNNRAEPAGTYPVLRMNNLAEGKVDISDLKYVDLDASMLDRYRLNSGDVLFNRTNSFELVGKTAYFDLADIYTFASYLVRLVVDRARVLPKYLNAVLNYESTQVRMKFLATRGVSQSNISPTKLKTLMISLPTMAEQHEIIRAIDGVDAKIAAEEDRRTALEALFKSMLHQLMTGQIRLLSDDGLPISR